MLSGSLTLLALRGRQGRAAAGACDSLRGDSAPHSVTLFGLWGKCAAEAALSERLTGAEERELPTASTSAKCEADPFAVLPPPCRGARGPAAGAPRRGTGGEGRGGEGFLRRWEKMGKRGCPSSVRKAAQERARVAQESYEDVPETVRSSEKSFRRGFRRGISRQMTNEGARGARGAGTNRLEPKKHPQERR